MTGLLVVNGIMSMGVLLVIGGMLARAIAADRGPRVGSKSRAAGSVRVPAPAASIVIASGE